MKDIKFYDKDITIHSEAIKEALAVIIIFLLGFLCGYLVGEGENANEEMSNMSTVSMYENSLQHRE